MGIAVLSMSLMKKLVMVVKNAKRFVDTMPSKLLKNVGNIKKKNKMIMKRKNFGSVATFAIVIALYLILVLIIMGLWNLIIPGITSWNCINFWQALGLTILCRLLCGNIHHFKGWFSHKHYDEHHRHNKLCNMSPEEREAFVRKRFENLVNDETSGKE
ncbi:MAG: hypothetical protein PHU66_06400 [Bacteroidaceae bacterium]|jgi:lipopolysaccharide/colanic/teichoic acid biosynthesis glycosyltransferase|nr:hypothetical protein [Bacteroidaceae bacterium]